MTLVVLTLKYNKCDGVFYTKNFYDNFYDCNFVCETTKNVTFFNAMVFYRKYD